jgi:BirA family biotin operon repressor/biotin-[acetyl-CoA-carboxylase] ligase
MLTAYDALPDLPADVAARYRDALATIGRGVRVELPARVLEGTATDVDHAGRLVVVDRAGATHHIDAGDVVHLR